MAVVTIYTKDWCPYCTAAKTLLADKGAPFTEINIGAKPELRAEMVQKAGGRTSVPQIFIDEHHVGGCDDLHALDARDELEALLRA
jgi:glutaredoxin 3